MLNIDGVACICDIALAAAALWVAVAPEVDAEVPADLSEPGQRDQVERRVVVGPGARHLLGLAPVGGDLVVEQRPSGYIVHGERVERLVERTNLESEGGLARFQSQLDRLGVNAALEAAGVKPGDAVRIAGVEFEYQP